MTEACPRCPSFVERCAGHGSFELVWLSKSVTHRGYIVTDSSEAGRAESFLTRAEADAEFDAREEALLA